MSEKLQLVKNPDARVMVEGKINKLVAAVGRQVRLAVADSEPVLHTKQVTMAAAPVVGEVEAMVVGRHGYTPVPTRKRQVIDTLEGQTNQPQRYTIGKVPVVAEGENIVEQTQRVIPVLNLGIFLTVNTETLASEVLRTELITIAERAIESFLDAVKQIPIEQVTAGKLVFFIQIQRVTGTELRPLQLTVPDGDVRDWKDVQVRSVVTQLSEQYKQVQPEVLTFSPQLLAQGITPIQVSQEIRRGEEKVILIKRTALELKDLPKSSMYVPPIVCTLITTDVDTMRVLEIPGQVLPKDYQPA